MISKLNNINSMKASERSPFYDVYWQKYGKGPGTQEKMRINFITKAIDDFKKKDHLKLLDLGCGRGWMAPFLSTRGTVTGVDFSLGGIEFARKNYGKNGKFFLADPRFPKLGLPEDESFDVVVCSEVIEHVEDPRALLQQIFSFLKDDGVCILTTPNGKVWPTYKQDPRFNNDLQPIENWLTPSQCVDLFKKVGFRIVRHEGRVWHKFRPGMFGWFQHKRVEKVFEKSGLSNLYARFVLPIGLYQMIVARKV